LADGSGGDDGSWCRFGGGCGFGCGGRGFAVGFWDLLDGGEVADERLGGDGFDGLGGGLLLLAEGEVGTGDLEAVEHRAGELAVDVSSGEAAEDVEEGDLDGGAVVDGLHGEDADAAGERGVRQAGAVVVVAEVLRTQGRRAAAAAIGVDVAAEITAAGVVLGGGGVHGVGYPLYFGPKVLVEQLLVAGCWLLVLGCQLSVLS